jgi:hypothetical protein
MNQLYRRWGADTDFDCDIFNAYEVVSQANNAQ